MNAVKKFEALEKEFFQGWVKRNPLLGTDLGFHSDYDHQIPDMTYEKLQDDMRFLRHAQADFEKIDARKLPKPRQVDHDLAIHTISLWRFEMEELRLWERVPVVPKLIGDSLFQLLSRNYVPLKKRLRSIRKRLDLLPRAIEEARSLLRDPRKIYVENELETITRIPGFFHSLKDVARNAMGLTPYTQLCEQVEAVHTAMEKYSDWLIVDVLSDCPDDFQMREAQYRKLLQMRGIPESPATLLRWGERETTRLRQKLKEQARQVKRKVALEDAREILRKQHPDHFDAVLRFTRDSIQKARQFVVRSGFAPIPPEENLYVIETPSYLRHFEPLGAYYPPAPFEEKNDGYLCMTPGDCDSNRLKEHNFASLSNRSAGYGYPGHHLRSAWAVRNPSLLRTFASAPETTEGWAAYCEERVKELGYNDGVPGRFTLNLDQLWHAIQVVLDIKLHTNRISIPRAVEMLIDETGMDRVSCEAEVRRYILTPGQPLSRMYGKERIRELRTWARGKMKSRFNDSFFHKEFLQAGALPIPILKKDLEWRIEEELKKPREVAPAMKKTKPRPPAKKKTKPSLPAKKKTKPSPHPKKKKVVPKKHPRGK